MPRIDVHSFYAESLQQHGDTAEGLHFQSETTQLARFRVLCDCFPETLSGLTLVDVGCGFGDFLFYLQERGGAPSRYIGIDIHERMVETARERTGAEILHRDVLKDPLPDADYYVCSGGMNTLTRAETREFMARCFDASTRGYLFNILRGSDYSEVFNYRQPDEIEAWASELGADCRIIDGYLHQDFTVALTRPA
ncbi:MAG: class I SAM-dependent methyltransferase [Thiohalocapsa sp.]